MKKSIVVAVISALVLGVASIATAQQPAPIKRIPLQKYEV